MITYLNQKFRIVMLLGLAVVAVSFVFFGNWSSGLSRGMGAVGKIDGRSVYQEQFLTERKAFEVSTLFVTAGRVNFSQMDNNTDVDNQTWARMVALDAARKAGIIVTDSEVRKTFLENPLLQENGAYSAEKHTNFVNIYLNPQGISEARFDEILREELTFRHFANMIASTATVEPAEVEKSFDELYGEITASLIRFDKATYAAKVKPTEDELKSFHQTHKSEYVRPEERTIEYVKFEITPEEQKLKDKALKDALYKAGEKALDFSSHFSQTEGKPAPDFAATATKAGVQISTGTAIRSPEGTKDPILSQPGVTSRAFALSKDQPFSDYVELPTGYAVLHLVGIKASEPLPYEEVKQKVQQDYILSHAVELMQKDAVTVRNQLTDLLSQKQTWEQATAKLGLKPVAVPPFTPDPNAAPKIPEARQVGMIAPEMAVGTVSGFELTADGGILLYLQKRSAPDEKLRAAILPRLKEYILHTKQNQLVSEWLVTRMVAPGYQPPANLLRQFGQGL